MIDWSGHNSHMILSSDQYIEINISVYDLSFEFRWRTKQNLDFCFLMMYCQKKARFYVQVEFCFQFFCTFYDSVSQRNIYCYEIVVFPDELSVMEILKGNVLLTWVLCCWKVHWLGIFCSVCLYFSLKMTLLPLLHSPLQ